MKSPHRRVAQVTFLAVAQLALAACGGGGSTSRPGTQGPGIQPYSVGGTVTGLVGQGLALNIYNAANLAHHDLLLRTLTISNDGAYRTSRASDGYGVLVRDQPHSPVQQCVTRNSWGSYLLGATPDDVTEVDVVCGEFSFVMDAAANTVSAIAVDATTGALMSAGSGVAAGSSPAAIAGSRDKRYLYVGNSGSNDVSVFAIDPASGTLTAIVGSPIAAGTKPRALSLYTSFSRIYGPPVERAFLYVANSVSNDLSAYQVDPRTGVPTRLSPASYPAGDGPTALIVDPIGPFLYTANTAGSKDMSAFLVDTLGGGLTPLAGSPFPSGRAVSNFALGAGGQFLYAAAAGGAEAAILGIRVNESTRALTGLGGLPVALPSCNSIVADQTGAYLYAAAGANVFGYSIDQQTGALSPLIGFPLAVGASADSLSIDPTNQFLYVGNGSAGTVTGFALNAATATLTPMPGSPFAVVSAADIIATF